MNTPTNARPLRFVTLSFSLFCVACGQQSQAQAPGNYVKARDWSSVCLGKLALDFPTALDMGAALTQHHSGYGILGVVGSATTVPRINGTDVQETRAATLQDLQNIRHLVAFNNKNATMSAREVEPHRIDRSGEAALGVSEAYGFNLGGAFDIGYLDPFDKRIRLFEGGTGKGEQATVGDIRSKYKEIRALYTARLPQTLPTESGICTPFGFFKDPPSGPVTDYSIDVPVRSLKYPSLIFFVTIKPPDANAPKDVSELPDPNRLTMDDIKSLKGMGAIAALAAMGGIKRTVGPEPIVVAGQPGRILAREYHHEGSLTTSSSGAAYEMQADVVGVQGRPDMPAITIKMAAALPDPDPVPPPTLGSFGQIHHYEVKRPALKGVKTPPFDEGMAYFKQVLASVRPLPALTAVARPAKPQP